MLDKKTVSQCISSDYCRGWNDAVDEMPRWISVEEKLPPLGEMLYCTHGGYVGVAWHHGEGKFETGGGMRLGKCDIPCWMPLPEPPKEE